MLTLEGYLISASEYRSDKPVTLTFVLVNRSEQDLYVLKWFTPLERLFSDCLNVSRDGERVPYDGPLAKRGTPAPEDYILVPAGDKVSRRFELGRTYDVFTPGSYEASLDTKIGDFFPVSSAESLEEAFGKRGGQRTKQILRGGETRFTIVSGEGAKRLTEGQAVRLRSRVKMKAEPLDAVLPSDVAAGAREPELIGGDANEQAETRQAHFDAYNLCLSALAALANDGHYNEWFGAYIDQRFQNVMAHFTSICNGMESNKFSYVLTGEGCQSSMYAYTHKGITQIWVCGKFWNAPSSGTDSKASALLHEHSHASAGTDDLAYDPDDCRQLAQDDPDRAVRNAANHEYFAD